MDIKNLLPILAPIVLICGIVGLFMENKLRFKYQGAFGRFTAYLFTGGLTMGVVYLLIPDLRQPLICVIALGIAILTFVIAFIKCPTNLRPTLFLGMYLTGWGVAMKISLFFFLFY